MYGNNLSCSSLNIHILWFTEIYWPYMHSILEYLNLLLIGLAESPDTNGRDSWVTSPSGYVPVLLFLAFHLQQQNRPVCRLAHLLCGYLVITLHPTPFWPGWQTIPYKGLLEHIQVNQTRPFLIHLQEVG